MAYAKTTIQLNTEPKANSRTRYVLQHSDKPAVVISETDLTSICAAALTQWQAMARTQKVEHGRKGDFAVVLGEHHGPVYAKLRAAYTGNGLKYTRGTIRAYVRKTDKQA